MAQRSIAAAAAAAVPPGLGFLAPGLAPGLVNKGALVGQPHPATIGAIGLHPSLFIPEMQQQAAVLQQQALQSASTPVPSKPPGENLFLPGGNALAALAHAQAQALATHAGQVPMAAPGPATTTMLQQTMAAAPGPQQAPAPQVLQPLAPTTFAGPPPAPQFLVPQPAPAQPAPTQPAQDANAPAAPAPVATPAPAPVAPAAPAPYDAAPTPLSAAAFGSLGSFGALSQAQRNSVLNLAALGLAPATSAMSLPATAAANATNTAGQNWFESSNNLAALVGNFSNQQQQQQQQQQQNDQNNNNNNNNKSGEPAPATAGPGRLSSSNLLSRLPSSGTIFPDSLSAVSLTGLLGTSANAPSSNNAGAPTSTNPLTSMLSLSNLLSRDPSMVDLGSGFPLSSIPLVPLTGAGPVSGPATAAIQAAFQAAAMAPSQSSNNGNKATTTTTTTTTTTSPAVLPSPQAAPGTTIVAAAPAAQPQGSDTKAIEEI